MSADHRGILINPGVITHSAISPPDTHLHSTHTEFIINQIVGSGSQCTIVLQAESYIAFRAESYKGFKKRRKTKSDSNSCMYINEP